MDYLLKKYLEKIDFESYEDFIKNYKVNVPDDFNFGFDVVDEWARVEPDKKALVWVNDNGDSHTFTFTEVKKYTNRICNYLKSIGIKKGDKVMLILKRHYEYWFTVVALHKIGAVAIPASYQLTEKDLIYRFNAIDVKMVICVDDENIIKHVETSLKESKSVKYTALVGVKRDGWIDFEEEYSKHSDVFERPSGEEAVGSNDLMLVYFTSGTTGMPKMVQHVQSYPLGHITTAKYWQCVRDNGLHLTVADSGWAKFSWGKIYGQWIAGSAVMGYDMEKFVPENLLNVICSYKVTTFCAPATMYRFMIKEDLSKYDFSSLKHCCMAGEPLNPEVYYKWEGITGHKLYEGFGQTEGTVLLANFPWINPKPGSTGKPSPLYDIRILHEDGRPCDMGEEGEIVIRDAKNNPPVGLTIGYYNDAKANEKLFANGDYHTGDHAWCDEDGHIWFIGRQDDVIKCSGYRIGPFEVESALMTHPSVLECAITAAPDPVRGQVVKATVVLAKGYVASDELKKELQNHVKKVTAPYKYPRIVEFVQELPKTSSGKIKRTDIRSSDESKYINN